jgi:hypothetical protein
MQITLSYKGPVFTLSQDISGLNREIGLGVGGSYPYVVLN